MREELNAALKEAMRSKETTALATLRLILAALKDMGGLKAQGYIYGKPETADQVRQRLRLAGLLTERGHPLRRSDSTSTAPHEDHQRRIFYP